MLGAIESQTPKLIYFKSSAHSSEVTVYSQEMLILAVVIAAFIGLLIGLLLGRSVFSGTSKSDKRDLVTARNELVNYKMEVAEHFKTSSDKLKQLKKQQKDIQEHLAKSAIKLTTPEQSRELIKTLESDEDDARLPGDQDINLLEGPKTLDHDSIHQPKDYAPKQPGESGTLSEEYRLKPTDEKVVEAPKL